MKNIKAKGISLSNVKISGKLILNLSFAFLLHFIMLEKNKNKIRFKLFSEIRQLKTTRTQKSKHFEQDFLEIRKCWVFISSN